MPALRIKKSYFEYQGPLKSRLNKAAAPPNLKQVTIEGKDVVTTNLNVTSKYPLEAPIRYPVTSEERASYRTKDGKEVTSHQWDVYDFVFSIPCGRVTTYKDVCDSVGGSPRSVGNALRKNPFAPYIPCHRVIASNLFIGGFKGEWGKTHRTGTHCNEKLDLLEREGIIFSPTGHLIDASITLWKCST